MAAATVGACGADDSAMGVTDAGGPATAVVVERDAAAEATDDGGKTTSATLFNTGASLVAVRSAKAGVGGRIVVAGGLSNGRQHGPVRCRLSCLWRA